MCSLNRASSWLRRSFTVGSIFILTASQNPVQATEQSKAEGVISAEASGKPIDRRAALANTSDDISQWQAGRILIDGQWMAIEDLQGHKLAANATAYKVQRNSQELDTEGHRRMAKWCKDHQLPEMAQVHWKAVVALMVNDEQANNALGHKKIGDHWFTAAELKRAAEEQKLAKTSLKRWMPVVRKIIARIQSSNAQTKLEGMKQLEQVDSIDAIPALKYAALQVEPNLALPIVSRIKLTRCKDACLALCDIAISDPNNEVGRLAIQGLKEYDEHFYVPELLQMLQLPVKLQQQYIYLPNGSLAIQRAYERESLDSKDRVEILKLVTLPESLTTALYNPGADQVYRFQPVAPGTLGDRRLALPSEVHVENPQAVSATKKLSAMAMRNADLKTDLSNQIQLQREQNAKIILSSISGLPANQSVEDYWNWWPSFNDSATNEKTSSETSYVDNSEAIVMTTNGTVFLPTNRHSCLVAGTVVQTSEGLKNVEMVEVGDMITSINIDNGEISLKPATLKTVRTAPSTYLVSLVDGETIRATGGHDWWIVGKGWVRSRDLAEGQYMRTGNSSVEIAKVEKIDAPINVYNMIVDENHTYFVGKDRLLSWDVTSLQPTLQTAPGQTLQMYAAKIKTNNTLRFCRKEHHLLNS